MAGPNGLRGNTWDSGTSAKIRLGITDCPLLKFTPGKYEIKVEKMGAIGSAIKAYRTPGIAELPDIEIELLTSNYEQFILPKLPETAGTELVFPVTSSLSHPSVFGSFSSLWDQCRIIGTQPPEFDASEKSMITKLTLSAILYFEKGRDGRWKCLARDRRPQISAEAQALLNF